MLVHPLSHRLHGVDGRNLAIHNLGGSLLSEIDKIFVYFVLVLFLGVGFLLAVRDNNRIHLNDLVPVLYDDSFIGGSVGIVFPLVVFVLLLETGTATFKPFAQGWGPQRVHYGLVQFCKLVEFPQVAKLLLEAGRQVLEQIQQIIKVQTSIIINIEAGIGAVVDVEALRAGRDVFLAPLQSPHQQVVEVPGQAPVHWRRVVD